MREISTRADRIGFGVFLLVAVVGAVLFATRQNNDPTVSSQGLTAVVSATDLAQPTVVPTTSPIMLPVASAVDGETLDDEAGGMSNDATLAIQASESVPVDASDTEEVDASPQALDQPSGADATSEIGSAGAADGTSTAAQPAGDTAAVAAPNPQPQPTEVPNPQPPATAVPNPQPQATAVPNPQPATSPVSAAPADAPAGGTFTHTLAATVARPTLHTAPGGTVFTPTFNGVALPAVNPTVFGNPLVYRVLAGQPGDAWAKVYVPARPNGTTAWVQTAQFNWGSSNRMLQINVANNTVTVFEGSQTLLTTSAVTGTTSSPTPLANGWVEEVMAGPSAAYGTQLISLGMFSETLNSFGGGIPKIALHGTNNPGLMGQYASNGCIRVRNEIIDQIVTMLPVGSKVVIVG